MRADPLVPVNKSVVANKSVAQSRSFLLYGRKSYPYLRTPEKERLKLNLTDLHLSVVDSACFANQLAVERNYLFFCQLFHFASTS